MLKRVEYRRFIPAGAGNTPKRPLATLSTTVYPRWRGEHPGLRDLLLRGSGLSPLARGTRTPATLNRTETRFIPAGAGNTYSCRLNLSYSAVYPRWRGEHMISCCHRMQRLGLSPLARGTLSPDPSPAIPIRFIPAGAGNTVVTAGSTPDNAVYPRWRGEHQPGKELRDDVSGLSPLARGTLVFCHARKVWKRFIPAGAGNTTRYRVASQSWSVYPRWRGEHASIGLTAVHSPGLSPLARGTPGWRPAPPALPRFIPAGAGNTEGCWCPPAPRAVYPRWRGEHRMNDIWSLVMPGLSPLARGTRGTHCQ